MKWLIIPSLFLGSLTGYYSNKHKEKPYDIVGEICAGADGFNGHCTWYTCFSGYTCGGGGVEFKCLRFGGNVIDP